MDEKVVAQSCHAEFEPLIGVRFIWLFFLAIPAIPTILYLVSVLLGSMPWTGLLALLATISLSTFWSIAVWHLGNRFCRKVRLYEYGLSMQSHGATIDIKWNAIKNIVDHHAFGVSLQIGNQWLYISPFLKDYDMLVAYIKLAAEGADHSLLESKHIANLEHKTTLKEINH